MENKVDHPGNLPGLRCHQATVGYTNEKKRVGFIARGLSQNGVQHIVNVLNEWNKNVSQVEIIVFTDEPTFKDTYTNLS